MNNETFDYSARNITHASIRIVPNDDLNYIIVFRFFLR